MQNDRHNKYDGRTEYLNELGTYAVGMLFLLVIFMAAYLVPGPAHSEPLEGAESAVDALGYPLRLRSLSGAQESGIWLRYGPEMPDMIGSKSLHPWLLPKQLTILWIGSF